MKNLRFGSMLEILELDQRTAYDVRPPKTDAIYLFGEMPDNEESPLLEGLRAYLLGDTLKVALLERIQVPHWPNQRQKWAQTLTTGGVQRENIIIIPVLKDWSFADPKKWPLNTYSELVCAIEYAKIHQWKKIGVTAAPFHQLRAFVTAVSVALRLYPEIKVYSRPGNPLSWTQEVVHSQGILRATRSQLIKHELDRIERYHIKGDLVSAREVLDYLNQRDKGI